MVAASPMPYGIKDALPEDVFSFSRLNGKAASCPFCGSDDQSMTHVQFRHVESKLYRVVCSCGTAGPLKGIMAEALAAWNRRYHE